MQGITKMCSVSHIPMNSNQSIKRRFAISFINSKTLQMVSDGGIHSLPLNPLPADRKHQRRLAVHENMQTRSKHDTGERNFVYNHTIKRRGGIISPAQVLEEKVPEISRTKMNRRYAVDENSKRIMKHLSSSITTERREPRDAHYFQSPCCHDIVLDDEYYRDGYLHLYEMIDCIYLNRYVDAKCITEVSLIPVLILDTLKEENRKFMEKSRKYPGKWFQSEDEDALSEIKKILVSLTKRLLAHNACKI